MLTLLLALAGAGVGAFMPANNAAVMRSAPPYRAGAASGVLNRTRAAGTALGLAVTGWLFGAFSGHATSGAATGRGFTAAALALAAAGAAAAWCARAQSSAGART
jgi:MFS family permease